MLEFKKKFYITTPIYYVNDKPHIGHAYTTIAVDVLARWHRLKGEDVFFLTGTDEHGEKVEIAAKENGKSPQEFVDSIVKTFKEAWKALNISNDDFIRTSEKRHEKVVQEFIKRMYKKGDIYKGKYEGWYCVPCESFWTELQLNNKRCPECGREVKLIKEDSYFFRLSKYQKKLLSFYKKNTEFISPKFRSNEIIKRVQGGLKDLSITRASFRWGIPFPIDKNFVSYVWFDALINYISALDWPKKKFKRYWPTDIHIIGKEINWFHSVIWPAILFSFGIKPPKKVFSHGWWTVEGKKMSKSLGNIVDPLDVAKKYSVDALRYFVIKEIPFGEDGNFSEKALINRINGELVADLGNLIYRILTLAEKFDGKIIGKPELSKSLQLKKIDSYMEKLELNNALEEIWKFIRTTNKYINENEPWKLEGKKLANVLYNLLEASRIIAILIYPFMPETAEKICEQLGVKMGNLKDCKFKKFSGKIKKGEYLFKKVEIKEIKKEGVGMLEISFDEFKNLDLRVGKVLEAERIEGSKNLLKLKVDFGTEKRIAVAGLAQHYMPEDLLGNEYMFILNLEKRKLMGVESECMIFAAVENGNVVLLKPEKEVKPGTKIS